MRIPLRSRDEPPTSSAGAHLLTAALAAVLEPLTGRPLGDLGLVRGAGTGRHGSSQLTVAMLSDEPSYGQRLLRAAERAVRVVDPAATVHLVPMTDGERTKVSAVLRREHRSPGVLGSRTKTYAVGSGKGGVGKSTVTVNLAAALAAQGQRVGVLDADVWGYSVPRLFGVREAPVAVQGIMLPVPAHGVRLMSVGFFVDEGEPVVWRGPMLHKALEQFLSDVFWGDLDILLVDLPPGTGDVAMSVLELLPDAALLVVTTPQRAAEEVAARVGRMARDARMPVAGVVENMSGGPFGAGGGEVLSKKLDSPLLGRVPLEAGLCAAGDAGTPYVLDPAAGPAGAELSRIARSLPVMRRSLVGRSLPLTVEAVT